MQTQNNAENDGDTYLVSTVLLLPLPLPLPLPLSETHTHILHFLPPTSSHFYFATSHLPFSFQSPSIHSSISHLPCSRFPILHSPPLTSPPYLYILIRICRGALPVRYVFSHTLLPPKKPSRPQGLNTKLIQYAAFTDSIQVYSRPYSRIQH